FPYPRSMKRSSTLALVVGWTSFAAFAACGGSGDSGTTGAGGATSSSAESSSRASSASIMSSTTVSSASAHGDDGATACDVDASGNIYVAGYRTAANQGTDILLQKYDPNGNCSGRRPTTASRT